jgi:precorrin isomerase
VRQKFEEHPLGEASAKVEKLIQKIIMTPESQRFMSLVELKEGERILVISALRSFQNALHDVWFVEKGL